MKPKFTKPFDNYVVEGDTISCELDNWTFTARIVRDDDSHIDDDDCHNPDQSVTGCNDEQQKELLKTRQAWFDDEWFYCSVVIDVAYNGIDILDYAVCLSSIEVNYPEDDNSHLMEVANELVEEAWEAAKEEKGRLAEKLA
jgi:hypothetical protein